MRRTVRWYVWKEKLFSVAETPDCDLKILGKTLAEHTAEKFGAEISEKFPLFSASEGEIAVVLRSSHTCLPKSAVEALVRGAEEEDKNIFFGAGWVFVKRGDPALAKYRPLKAGAAFLAPTDYPFVSEALRQEILKKLLRRGVIIENTCGVYVDATAFVESGVVLSHDVTIRGKSLVRGGAKIHPYTVIEDAVIASGTEVGPFAYIRPDRLNRTGRYETKR